MRYSNFDKKKKQTLNVPVKQERIFAHVYFFIKKKKDRENKITHNNIKLTSKNDSIINFSPCKTETKLVHEQNKKNKAKMKLVLFLRVIFLFPFCVDKFLPFTPILLVIF